MKILGIETSCDETAIAILDIEENENGTTVKVLANEILSQIELHRPYGGVFPNLAKREHEKNLDPILHKALMAARYSGGYVERDGARPSDSPAGEYASSEKPAAMSAIAVTQGPGLEPCLWTGITFAKELAKKWNVPLIPANHMEGHIVASLLKKDGEHYSFSIPEFPSLALLISGGHTEIVFMREFGTYEIVGKTRDDAVGECFDKPRACSGSNILAVRKFPNSQQKREKKI